MSETAICETLETLFHLNVSDAIYDPFLMKEQAYLKSTISLRDIDTANALDQLPVRAAAISVEQISQSPS